MILYILYRLGVFVAESIPLRISYGIACWIADVCRYFKPDDRKALSNNLRMVLGEAIQDREIDRLVRDSFRNFAKYLVDFFRFTKIDSRYIKEYVTVEGIENIDAALKYGRGAILLSAHIGNWELGGSVLSQIGYPTSAVVLTHKNKRINDFFTRQRLVGKMKPIEIGMALKSCFGILKHNGLLALLGDRDFTRGGISVDFFGVNTLVPKGPAVFSYRIGSPIVPSFMLREPGDKFRLVFGRPIIPEKILKKTEEDESLGRKDYENQSIRHIVREYLSVIEAYIKRYPSQWYVFREVWNNGAKYMRPDTII